MTSGDGSDLEPRLINWGRWCRTGMRFGQAESFEGNYRSPQHWWPEGPRPTLPNSADAWDICLACATIDLKYHLTLKLRYVAQQHDAVIGRVLRRECGELVAARDIPAVEGMARVMLISALSQPIKTRRQRARDRIDKIISKVLDISPELS